MPLGPKAVEKLIIRLIFEFIYISSIKFVNIIAQIHICGCVSGHLNEFVFGQRTRIIVSYQKRRFLHEKNNVKTTF